MPLGVGNLETKLKGLATEEIALAYGVTASVEQAMRGTAVDTRQVWLLMASAAISKLDAAGAAPELSILYDSAWDALAHAGLAKARAEISIN